MEIVVTKSGQYAVRFYHTFKDGTKKRVQLTDKTWRTATMKKAEFKLVAMKAISDKVEELNAYQEARNAAQLRLDTLIGKYIDFDRTLNRETSSRAKQGRLKNYLGKYFHLDSDVTKIFDTKTISDFRLWLAGLNMSNESTSHIIMATKQFLDFLVAQELLPGSLVFSLKAILVPIKKTNEEEMKEEEVGENFWTKEEYDTFIASFEESDPYRFFFYLSFWLATRIGETTALKFSDFNKDEKSVSIVRQINTMGKLTATKTKGSKAKIFVPSHVFDNLEKYKSLVAVGGVAPADSDFLFFPSGHIARTTIRRVLYAHCEKCNLKKITPHGFRHSMASYLLSSGFDYMDVSKYLRHSSPNITLSTYAHWIEKKGARNFENLKE